MSARDRVGLGWRPELAAPQACVEGGRPESAVLLGRAGDQNGKPDVYLYTDVRKLTLVPRAS